MIQNSLKLLFSYLSDNGLSFVALLRPNHLNSLIIFAQTYNKLHIVIDHMSKPKNVIDKIDQWMKDMNELSRLDNVYFKCSGTGTEVGECYTIPQIILYIDFILKTFDIKRLLRGSDWPVLTITDNYGKSFDLAMDFCPKLFEHKQLDIFSNAAKNFYRI